MPLQVKLDMTVFSISNINFTEGLFEAELGLQMSWEDEKMQVCQCSERQSREFIRLPGRMKDKIWMPDLVIMSVVEVQKEEGISKHSGIRLVHHHDSTVVVSDSRIQAVIDCKFNSDKFPFDNNNCSVRVCSDLHPSSQLDISMKKLPRMLSKTSPGYTITLEHLPIDESRVSPPSKQTEGQYHCGGFKLVIARRGVAVMTIYSVIMGMLVIMYTLTVILPYPAVDRLAPMAVLLIGALTVFSTVSRSFPLPDTTMSPLVTFILVSIILCCVILNTNEAFRINRMEWIDKISLAWTTLVMTVNLLFVWMGWKGEGDNIYWLG